jgi:hypothetical protein
MGRRYKASRNLPRVTPRAMETYTVWNGTPDASEGNMLIVRQGNCPFATLYNAHNKGDLPNECDYCWILTDERTDENRENHTCGVNVGF